MINYSQRGEASRFSWNSSEVTSSASNESVHRYLTLNVLLFGDTTFVCKARVRTAVSCTNRPSLLSPAPYSSCLFAAPRNTNSSGDGAGAHLLFNRLSTPTHTQGRVGHFFNMSFGPRERWACFAQRCRPRAIVFPDDD